jgi:hypothetical protein
MTKSNMRNTTIYPKYRIILLNGDDTGSAPAATLAQALDLFEQVKRIAGDTCPIALVEGDLVIKEHLP